MSSSGNHHNNKLFTRIIIGTFIVGTFAYLVANALDKLLNTILDYYDPISPVHRIFLTGAYFVAITAIAIVVLLMLTKYNFIISDENGNMA